MPGLDQEPSYPVVTRSKTLTRATNDAALLRKTAIALLDEAKLEDAIRLVGLSVSQLEPSGRQLELFADAAEIRHERIGAAVDAIVERFGKKAIGRAVAAPDKLTPSGRRKPGSS
jgi:DNA polymerase-4